MTRFLSLEKHWRKTNFKLKVAPGQTREKASFVRRDWGKHARIGSKRSGSRMPVKLNYWQNITLKMTEFQRFIPCFCGYFNSVKAVQIRKSG